LQPPHAKSPDSLSVLIRQGGIFPKPICLFALLLTRNEVVEAFAYVVYLLEGVGATAARDVDFVADAHAEVFVCYVAEPFFETVSVTDTFDTLNGLIANQVLDFQVPDLLRVRPKIYLSFQLDLQLFPLRIRMHPILSFPYRVEVVQLCLRFALFGCALFNADPTLTLVTHAGEGHLERGPGVAF